VKKKTSIKLYSLILKTKITSEKKNISEKNEKKKSYLKTLLFL